MLGYAIFHFAMYNNLVFVFNITGTKDYRASLVDFKDHKFPVKRPNKNECRVIKNHPKISVKRTVKFAVLDLELSENVPEGIIENSIEISDEELDFQVYIEVDGRNEVIYIHKSTTMGQLVDKVSYVLNIPFFDVHLTLNHHPLNMEALNVTCDSMHIEEENVLHVNLYLGAAGMRKRDFSSSQDSDRGFSNKKLYYLFNIVVLQKPKNI